MTDLESFLSTQLPNSETEHIAGNASRSTKELTVKWNFLLQSKGFEYGHEHGLKVRTMEVWVEGHPDRPDGILDPPEDQAYEQRIRDGVQESSQIRLVSEVTVEPGERCTLCVFTGCKLKRISRHV